MRVLVCGGRDFGLTEKERLSASWTLARLHGQNRFTRIIEGGARGADACGRRFGEFARVPVETFKADWSAFGRRAGPLRNQRMLAEGKPDLVVAFPGGAGTADMVRRARVAGVEVVEVPR